MYGFDVNFLIHGTLFAVYKFFMEYFMGSYGYEGPKIIPKTHKMNL